MRWLVVDNHDSYTHNLVQLLAVASGTDPVVVSDDDVAPGELDLEGFAGVVVSPGPGHPANPRDFALSADVLARAQVPVLGVCLGMQGIALAAGAVVDAAPQPRHGFVDRVRHTGDSVLAGLPQGSTPPATTRSGWPNPCPTSWNPWRGGRTACSWRCGAGTGPRSGCSSTRSRWPAPRAR